MIYLKLYDDNELFAANQAKYDVGLTDKENFHALPSVCLLEGKEMEDDEYLNSAEGNEDGYRELSLVNYNPRPYVENETLIYDSKKRIFFELQIMNTDETVDGEPIPDYVEKVFDTSIYETDEELEEAFDEAFTEDEKQNLTLVINPNNVPYKGYAKPDESTTDGSDYILYLIK